MVYTVQHFENDDESEHEEEEEEEEEEEKEVKEEEKKEEEEIKEKTEEKKNEVNEEENKEGEGKGENQSVKIYIYGNSGNIMANKYYSEKPIGFFEFKMINSDINGQNFINENDIRITVDDYDDFTKNTK